MSTPQLFDARKFREAIIYICDRSSDDPRFGSVKLNKVLFFADFHAYTRLGQAITGAVYRHLAEGPAPRDMLLYRAQLVDENAIRMEDRDYFNRRQKRPVALRQADLSVFTADEIVILDNVIAFLWAKDATDATELSHREWGWKLTNLNEEIPYRTAWLSSEPLTQEELEFASRIPEER